MCDLYAGSTGQNTGRSLIRLRQVWRARRDNECDLFRLGCLIIHHDR